MTFKQFKRPSFDAEKAGADCANCPLNHRQPVPCQHSRTPNPRLIILGESPGRDENYQGRPFVGKTGDWLNEQLADAGFDREDAHITNAVACLPLKHMSKSKWKKARECCSKRLQKELSQIDKKVPILALGEQAMQAVAPRREALSEWVGYPIVSNGRVVIPNYHPTFAAFYRPELRNTFVTWLRRAIKLASGTFAHWQWPKDRMILSQNDSNLQKVLASFTACNALVVDIESIPGRDIITRMGLSNGDWTISLPWNAYDTKKYGSVERIRPEIEQQVRELLRTKHLIAHNGQFDIVHLKQKGFALRDNWGLIHDTLAGHAACNQQEPHDLGYVVTSNFCIPRYKTEFHALGNEKGSDRWVEVNEQDMAEYNAGDAFVTWLEYQRQLNVFKSDKSKADRFNELMQLIDVTVKMKFYGWRIDLGTLSQHRDKLTIIVKEKLELIQKLAKAAGFERIKRFKKKANVELQFNPGSSKDIKTLFGKLGVGVVKLSLETNEASFDKEVLKELIAHVDEKIALTARLLVSYRENNKLLTSYAKGKHIEDDGFIRPTWNPWGAISGRFSCHAPAVQTIPKKMRDIFVASHPEKYIVQADYKQLEMVIAAYGANAKLLSQWIAEEKDTHLETAKLIFNDPNMTKKDIRRQASKKVNYSLLYGAGIDKMYTDLKIEFPDINREMVEHVYKETKKIHPELIELIASTEEFLKENKYSETFISGRRRYEFGDDVDLPEFFNHRIQGTAADLTNRAIVGISQEIDWDGTRILGQIHDAIVLETNDLETTTDLLKKWMEMPVKIKGIDRVFGIDVEYGKSWGKMEALK